MTQYPTHITETDIYKQYLSLLPTMHSEIFYSTLYANCQQTFNVKGWMVNILGFMGCTVPFAIVVVHTNTFIYNSQDFVHPSDKISQFSHTEHPPPHPK